MTRRVLRVTGRLREPEVVCSKESVTTTENVLHRNCSLLYLRAGSESITTAHDSIRRAAATCEAVWMSKVRVVFLPRSRVGRACTRFTSGIEQQCNEDIYGAVHQFNPLLPMLLDAARAANNIRRSALPSSEGQQPALKPTEWAQPVNRLSRSDVWQ